MKIFQRVLKGKRLLALARSSVRRSVRMEKHGSRWTDFREISYWKFLLKSVQEIYIWRKYDNNNGHFT